MNLIEPLKNDPEGRIVEHAEYGQHIALACKNHPDQKYTSKNIAPIGCRSLFYRTYEKTECSCPVTDLRPIAPE
jgi:hypothetical protein